MGFEMCHYAGEALQVLLLALTVLGLILNILFLLLVVVLFLMYRKAMGCLGLFESVTKAYGEGEVSRAEAS